MDEWTIYILSGTPGEPGVKPQLHPTWLVHNQHEQVIHCMVPLAASICNAMNTLKAVKISMDQWCDGSIATCQLMTGRS